MIILDASVAAKWFLPEDGSDRAEAVLETHLDLRAPELIYAEVTGAITRAARTGDVTIAFAREACREWFEVVAQKRLRMAEDKLFMQEAAELAFTLKHGLQDCLYLAYAIEQHVTLITADRTFYKRAKPAYNAIELL